MNGMMAGMGLWTLLLIVTVVAVLVAAVLAGVWLVRGLRGDRSAANRAAGGAELAETAPDNGAREVLRRRYAAGEIDEEEYERRLAGLTWR